MSKKRMREWLSKRQNLISDLSERLGIYWNESSQRWVYRDSSGQFKPVMAAHYLLPEFRRLVAERDYYLGVLQFCRFNNIFLG